MSSSTAIVIDNGSGTIKAGLARRNLPSAIFPTILGKPEKVGILSGMGQKDDYVGIEAQLKKGVLDIRYPMEHGIVKDWEGMERIWHHAFYHCLKVAPEEHPLLLSEAALNPRSNRELMAETMFETFYSPKLYVIIQSALVLYSSGYVSGLVVDSGDGLTFSVPFFEGAAIQPAIRRLEMGGRDLTAYLVKLLGEKGYSYSSSAGFDLIRDIKEKMCSVADNIDEKLRFFSSQMEESYTLPDGNEIKLGPEKYRCPEALFDPSLIGLEFDGIHKMASTSVMKCGVDVRKDLYSNVILAGGSTTFPGFVRRFEESMSSILPSTLKVKINAPSERICSTWIGGSILSSLSTFQMMWISRKEYDEVGSTIVSKKCF